MDKQNRKLTNDDRELIQQVIDYTNFKRDLEQVVYGKDLGEDATLIAKPRDAIERQQLLEWAGSDITERYKITGLLNEDLGIQVTEVYDDDFN